MLPVLVSQMVVVLKDTAIGYQITFLEMVRQGTQVGSSYGNYVPALIVIAAADDHRELPLLGASRRGWRVGCAGHASGPEPMHIQPVTQGSFGAGAGGTI